MRTDRQNIGARARYAAMATLLACAPVFILLGLWQLARADQQEAMQAAAQAARAAAPLDLQRERIVPGHAYRRAIATGEFLPSQYFLQGRSEAGRPGYGMVAVMRAGGNHVLVERGYTPRAEGMAPPGRRRVEGVLLPARLPPLQMGELRGAVRPFLDPRAIGDELGIELAPLVLHAKPPPLPPLKGAMHVGYAIQWFVFAAVALVALVALVRNR